MYIHSLWGGVYSLLSPPPPRQILRCTWTTFHSKHVTCHIANTADLLVKHSTPCKPFNPSNYFQSQNSPSSSLSVQLASVVFTFTVNTRIPTSFWPLPKILYKTRGFPRSRNQYLYNLKCSGNRLQDVKKCKKLQYSSSPQMLRVLIVCPYRYEVYLTKQFMFKAMKCIGLYILIIYIYFNYPTQLYK